MGFVSERTCPPADPRAGDVSRELLAAPIARPLLVLGNLAVARRVLARGTPLAPLAVVGFTVVGGRIAAIDLITDRATLRR